MRRRSILGLVGAFAASALPFGLHTAEADGKTRPGGAVTFFKWVPTVSGTTILTRDATAVQAVNTTTETALLEYELPAGVLGSDRALRLQLVGTQKNDTDVATINAMRWRIKLGATTLWDSVGQDDYGNGGAYEAPWRFDVTITETGAGAQMLTGAAWVAQTTSTPPTTGAGGLGAGCDVANIYGTSTEDETTALTLTVTVENSTADPDINCTKRFAALELL